MERIKNIKEVIVPCNMLLCKVHTKDTKGIILSPKEPISIDYLTVVAIGNSITDISPGDIILDTIKYQYDNIISINNDYYLLIYRNQCNIGVHPDNFKM